MAGKVALSRITVNAPPEEVRHLAKRLEDSLEHFLQSVKQGLSFRFRNADRISLKVHCARATAAQKLPRPLARYTV